MAPIISSSNILSPSSLINPHYDTMQASSFPKIYHKDACLFLLVSPDQHTQQHQHFFALALAQLKALCADLVTDLTTAASQTHCITLIMQRSHHHANQASLQAVDEAGACKQIFPITLIVTTFDKISHVKDYIKVISQAELVLFEYTPHLLYYFLYRYSSMEQVLWTSFGVQPLECSSDGGVGGARKHEEQRRGESVIVNSIILSPLLFFVITRIVNERVGKPWKLFISHKTCEVSYATIQGIDCLLAKFRNSVVMEEYSAFRPKLWYHIDSTDMPKGMMIGDEAPFPPPNNGQKRRRSRDNASTVGLFPPNHKKGFHGQVHSFRESPSW